MSVVRFLRVHDWGIQLPIFSVAAGALFCGLAVRPDDYWNTVGWLTVVQAVLLPGAYTINDYFDWNADRAKHLLRPSAWSRSSRLLASLLLFTAAFLLTHRTLIHTGVHAIVWAQVLLAIAYSAPPLRLKERALLGVLCAAGLQRVPPFVALALWANAPLAIAGPITLWLLVLGLLFIVEHQLQDRASDRAAGVSTFVLALDARGRVRLRRSLYALLPVAAAAAALIVIVARRDASAWLAAAILFAASAALDRILRWYYSRNEDLPLAVASRVLRAEVDA
jgi:4-hydroxybenzoate polyprenyltransferase